MSWQRPDDRHDRERERRRSPVPVWETRRDSPPRDRYRDRRDYERRDRRDRYDRERDRSRDNRDRDSRDRYDRRDRDRWRSPSRRCDDKDPSMPAPPSPPKISGGGDRSRSRSPPVHEEKRPEVTEKHEERPEESERHEGTTFSPGDWLCKCGSYNFKRRMYCFRRTCNGKRADGTVYEGNPGTENIGITKKLLFRRLDALTTEETILEAMKDRCSKEVVNSVAGITIGRQTSTGVSRCLAYINFNSIADSTAALTELQGLQPPLVIDNRQVLISYYNDVKPKYHYSAGMYANTQQNLSEADRVNAAAAVAQSAISKAHARQMWTPTSAPTFVASATAAVGTVKAPVGDGVTVYTPPDVRTFMYDETSGYYYDPVTSLYYDGNTQYFYNNQINKYMYWDAATNTYKSATQTQQNTDQPKLPQPPEATVENTIVKDPPEEKKKKEKEDKVKVAKKIAKDMERWARTLNQRKENAKSNIVMEQPLDMGPSKGSADIGFSVLGAGPSVNREVSPPKADEFLIKETPMEDDDEGIIDWTKLTCLLCKRKFPSADVLTKHKTMSDLHKQNLAEFRKVNESQSQSNGYRDRAAERRMKFGEDEVPVKRRYEHEPAPPPPAFAPAPSVVDTIGGKMLQKMGWSQGRGLGKAEQGRIAPIEAEQRPSLAGLGQKKGIYTPTPGETYRDTVKKLMIARYKEVVGQEDGN